MTPFELQLALQPSPTWTGEYVLDFDEVLARGPSKPLSDKDEEVEEGDPDRPIFSLITGKYRHAKRYGGEILGASFFCFLLTENTTENDQPAPPSSSSAVVLRDQDGTVTTLRDSAAGVLFPTLCDLLEAESFFCEGEFLQSRTFRGLETRAGLDPPNVLQQGRSGIARGYGDDYRA